MRGRFGFAPLDLVLGRFGGIWFGITFSFLCRRILSRFAEDGIQVWANFGKGGSIVGFRLPTLAHDIVQFRRTVRRFVHSVFVLQVFENVHWLDGRIRNTGARHHFPTCNTERPDVRFFATGK